VNIVLDHKALKDQGIAGNTPVSISVQEKPRDEALKQLLATLKATYVIDHEVILIKPAAQAKSKK